MSFILEQNSLTFVYYLNQIEKEKKKERGHFLYCYIAYFITEHIHFRLKHSFILLLLL